MRLKANEFKKEQVMDSFGDRVTHLLKEMRLTKTWLADRIGISKQNINYLLHYASKPRYLSEIAQALDVRAEWLSTGSGPINMLKDNTRHFHIIPLFTYQGFNDHTSNVSDTSTADAGLLAEVDMPKQAFAIRLEHDLGEPMFSAGNTLIFIPETNANYTGYKLTSMQHDNKLVLKHTDINQQRVLYNRNNSGTKNNSRGDKDQEKTLGVLIEIRMMFAPPKQRSLNEVKFHLN
jgi:DNA-binding Xre family transcriptional regulator